MQPQATGTADRGHQQWRGGAKGEVEETADCRTVVSNVVYNLLGWQWYGQVITNPKWLNPAGESPDHDLILDAECDVANVLASDIAADVAERVAKTISAAKDKFLNSKDHESEENHESPNEHDSNNELVATDELLIPALASAVRDVVFTTLKDIIISTAFAKDKVLNPAMDTPAAWTTAATFAVILANSEFTLADDMAMEIAAEVAALVTRAISIRQAGTKDEFDNGELSIPANVACVDATVEECEAELAPPAAAADLGKAETKKGIASDVAERVAETISTVKYEFLNPAADAKNDFAEDELLTPADEHVAKDELLILPAEHAVEDELLTPADEHVAKAELLILPAEHAVEDELLIPAEVDAAPWRKNEYIDVKSKYLITYGSRAGWLISQERHHCISRMPLRELKKRRFA
jgi:hypothetical protein